MSIRVVKRAYKHRFSPAPEQAGLLNRTFGPVRYAYGQALAEQSRAWTQEQRRVTFAETCRMLTAWKNDPDTAWLYPVPNVALQHLQSRRAAPAERLRQLLGQTRQVPHVGRPRCPLIHPPPAN